MFEELINLSELNKEKLNELIELIKIDTNMAEWAFWDILEDKFSILFDKEKILEIFNEQESSFLFLTILINKSIKEKISNENINFLVKNLGSKYVQNKEDKIKCLNSNIEPFFNAIKAGVFVYEKTGEKISIEDLCLTKNIIGYILKEILIQKEKVQELAIKLNKEEMIKTFVDNIQVVKKLMFNILNEGKINNAESDTIVQPLSVNYEKIFKKIDENTEKIISSVIEKISTNTNTLQTDSMPKTENNNLTVDDSFIVQSVKDALIENKETLLTEIKTTMEEKVNDLNELIEEIKEAKNSLQESVEMLDNKGKYIDDTNNQLSNIKAYSADNKAHLENVEKILIEFYNRYKQDIEKVEQEYESHKK